MNINQNIKTYSWFSSNSEIKKMKAYLKTNLKYTACIKLKKKDVSEFDG